MVLRHFGVQCSVARCNAFVSPYLDDCGANSSIASAWCGAALYTHDKSGAVPLGNRGTRGLRDHPSCGSPYGLDHRLGPESWPEVLQRPRLTLVP